MKINLTFHAVKQFKQSHLEDEKERSRNKAALQSGGYVFWLVQRGHMNIKKKKKKEPQVVNQASILDNPSSGD